MCVLASQGLLRYSKIHMYDLLSSVLGIIFSKCGVLLCMSEIILLMSYILCHIPHNPQLLIILNNTKIQLSHKLSRVCSPAQPPPMSPLLIMQGFNTTCSSYLHLSSLQVVRYGTNTHPHTPQCPPHPMRALLVAKQLFLKTQLQVLLHR